MTKQYTGWTNYETWSVAIALSQNAASWRFWMEQAQDVAVNATSSRPVEGGAAALAIRSLANKLAARFHQNESLADPQTSPLVLTDVNWQEVAADLLARVTPTTEGQGSAWDDDSRWLRSAFETGELVITPAALTALTQWEILEAFFRHERGDWGAVCSEDWAENQFSLRKGLRLFSAYVAADGIKFWIITEADRSVTTVLLPSDY